MNETFEDLGILDMKWGVEQHRIRNAEETDDFLAHYGIPGQKHGVRRYQYEDGSYTPEGKERYASDSGSGGVRGRRRTTNTVQVEDVHKTESVNQGKGNTPQMTQTVMPSTIPQSHANLSDKKTNKMSDDEYTKTKQELAKRDFVQVYDGNEGKMIYVKKDEFRDHIKKLASQGIEVKMPYLDSPDKSDDSMSDIRMKNAEVRYWNELVEKAQSQTYTGPESEDILTKDNEKARRKEIAERQAAIKTKVEEHRKKSPALMQSDEDEDSLQHYGILNMRWGVRRYQNEDGSLTAEGRKRYGVGEAREGSGKASEATRSSGSSSGDSENRAQARSASEMTDDELNKAINRIKKEREYEELTGAKPSSQYQNQQDFRDLPNNTNTLSNEELQAYINRLNMEKQYKQLTTPPPKELTWGQKFVKEVLPAVAMEVAKEFAKNTMKKLVGLDGNDKGNNDNDDGKKKQKSKGQQKNYDKQFSETNNRLDKLGNAINALATQQKQQPSSSNNNSANNSSDDKKKKKQQSSAPSNAGYSSNWTYGSGGGNYNYYNSPWTYSINRV